MRRLLLPLLFTFACEQQPIDVTIEPVASPTESLLQAISIVDENVAWLSGHNATFVRTIDGGSTWKEYKHPVDILQFRDIHANNDAEVILMAAGPRKASGIYKYSVEEDAFTQTYEMTDENGFLNSIEFWDEKTGLAFGDSFNGELFILKTEDGGDSWERVDPSTLPPAGDGEGGFAASGTCISTQPGGLAWIGTGAGGNARILQTKDFGVTWESIPTPIVTGEMAGIFSTRLANQKVAILSGGDLGTESPSGHLAITDDAGENWTMASKPITQGTFYGSDLEEFRGQWIWVICGPEGIDYSTDKGTSWTQLDTTNYWAVEVHVSGFGYASGKDGRISKLLIE